MGTMVSALFRESLAIWARGPVAALTKWEWLCVGGQHCYDRNLDLALIPLKILQAGLSHIPSYLAIQLPPLCLVIDT